MKQFYEPALKINKSLCEVSALQFIALSAMEKPFSLHSYPFLIMYKS